MRKGRREASKIEPDCQHNRCLLDQFTQASADFGKNLRKFLKRLGNLLKPGVFVAMLLADECAAKR